VFVPDPELMDRPHDDIGEQARGLWFSLPVNVEEGAITGHELVRGAVVRTKGDGTDVPDPLVPGASSPH